MQDASILPNIVQQITDWSAINSGSWHASGLERMADTLSKAFDVLDGTIARIPVAPYTTLGLGGQAETLPKTDILSICKRPTAPLQILFVGHMDTVYSPAHPFQTVWQESDRLRGPGVADMKGGLCLLLWALKHWETLPEAQALGWQVIITPDEEIGSHGSMPYLLDCAAQHHIGLVFEPTIDDLGNLASTRRGSGKFTILAKGKAAHVGRSFNEGENAIVALANLIPKIHNLNTERSTLTVNVGQIHGGDAVNVVAPLAGCKLDVRIADSADAEWFKARLQYLIEKENTKNKCAFQWEGDFTRPPKTKTPGWQRLHDCLQVAATSLGQTLAFRPSGGCCDGNNLAAAGLPNIDTLGVYGGAIHSDQEYLIIPKLLDRLQLIVTLLQVLVKHKTDFIKIRK